MSETGQIPSKVAVLYGYQVLEGALQAMPTIAPLVGRLQDVMVSANQLTHMAFSFLESIGGEENFGMLHFLLLFGEDREVAESLFESAQKMGWVRISETQAFYFDEAALIDSLGKVCVTDFDIKYHS